MIRSKRAGFEGQPRAFQTRVFNWPLNVGTQIVLWQAGGPRGGSTAGAVQPYPYLTGFKNFITAFPYGVASSLVGNSGVGNNLGAGYAAFNPIGMMKPQTYTAVSF